MHGQKGSYKAPETETGHGGRTLVRLAAVSLVALLLSACSGHMVPARKGAQRPPAKTRPAPPPAYSANSPEYRQCRVNLAGLKVQYTPLPDRRYDGGCTAYGAVKLLDVGVPITNLGAMTCPLAEKFSAWARYGVAPAARLLLGSDLVRIETMGTYSCRPIAGSSKLSEHAHSNAVDVSAFVLADGRRITIQGDWNQGSKNARQFLRAIRESACKRFRTVLSPEYNAAHYDHLHFDMGGKGIYCR